MKITFWAGLLFLLVLIDSVSAATFKGKVVDADTKEPIEGAVVVASWLEEVATFTATHSRVKEVKEVLTDKNGEWIIKGPKGGEIGHIKTIISLFTGMHFTRLPYFVIFKPGYCSWPDGLSIDSCKESIRPSGVGQGAITKLPRLKKRDRMTVIQNVPSLGMADEFEDSLPLYKALRQQEEKDIRK